MRKLCFVFVFCCITKACKPVLVVIQNENMNLRMSIVWLLHDDVTGFPTSGEQD